MRLIDSPIESDVETTPREASKLPRLAKTTVTWRWCAPPACHPAYSRSRNRQSDFTKRRVPRGVGIFKRNRRFSPRSIFFTAHGIESVAWLATLKKLRSLTCVACVYYPLVCRWSSEARRRIARVSPGGPPWSICRRLRNPLSSTEPPLASLVGLPPHRPSYADAYDSVREEWQGEIKKSKPPLTCLLVFVRDRSVHVKHGPPTCRLEMKLPFTCSCTPLSHDIKNSPREARGRFSGWIFFFEPFEEVESNVLSRRRKVKLVGRRLAGLNTTPLLRMRSLTSLARFYRRDVTRSCAWEDIHQ